jgi:hypothetical protein
MTTPSPTAQLFQQPVDRARRYRLVFGVVSFALLTSAFFTVIAAFGWISGLYTDLIGEYTKAAMSLAGAATLAYITGSVVDYNGGVANLFVPTKRSSQVFTPEDLSDGEAPATEHEKAKG